MIGNCAVKRNQCLTVCLRHLRDVIKAVTDACLQMLGTETVLERCGGASVKDERTGAAYEHNEVVCQKSTSPCCGLSIFKKSRRKLHIACDDVEQVKGVEPSSSAWEADVLPMNYTCTAEVL